ncbi:hypothetical protein K1T73_16640 [Roseovarius sp. SCSIO 43702]|uniref:hypothetical protein n=1 Tax=Roseovarius sp. SCSIO 43702 TaxID=2823043 RepID=UPI001C734F75|nr:hypothetical protein [Roseovarius sp. SCSIO 43702]QYX56641.1 hypothetical protein K1T73_16640 [Roseovarius sp. SCSIO 43702]
MYLMLCLISGAVGGVSLGRLRAPMGRLPATLLGLAGGGAAYGCLALLGAGGTRTGAVDTGVTLTQVGAGVAGGAILVALLGWARRRAGR